jgi:succinyl-CoA synthetase beta subunit
MDIKDIITKAIERGDKALNEFDSKAVLRGYSIPVAKEKLARNIHEAREFADGIGYPVVLKGSSTVLTHKTEMNLVELGIRDDRELIRAYREIEERGRGQLDGMLIQEMVIGQRELVAGMTRDPQFGPCVMFGLGGIFTEVLKDVSFRVAPLKKIDALNLMDEIRSRKILDEFRGKPAVHRGVLADILVNLGRLGMEQDDIAEVDINPLIVKGDIPIAVDALIILRQKK